MEVWSKLNKASFIYDVVQSAAAGHVHQNSSAHVVRRGHLDLLLFWSTVALSDRLDDVIDERSFNHIRCYAISKDAIMSNLAEFLATEQQI